MRRSIVALLAAVLTLSIAPSAHASSQPKPGSLQFLLQDAQSILDAYGRITAPGGQLLNPAYLPALASQIPGVTLAQLLKIAASPTRPPLTAGALVPGWNVGNPLRASWDGTRGVETSVSFTNRYGALLRGTVYSPLPNARDPYTGEVLTGPFPGVVLTPGSLQGSGGMYEWLGQDLAERGYVVLVYDVQGQGMSETLPHESGSDLPFCFPFDAPKPLEMLGCPGVPSQQEANFVYGTLDATDFFFSTPDAPYANPGRASAKVDAFNPLWESFDRRPLEHETAPGRSARFAIIGHSLGASAISRVQGDDPRVSTVVALDKLRSDGGDDAIVPSVPALALQSEYSLLVTPTSASEGIVANRERVTGYDGWTASGLDAMLIVPRASTHMEYTDIPLVMPASRYGQALSSVYTQAWLDHWLKDASIAPLLATSWSYLEPTGGGRWTPTRLDRSKLLSTRYCSAYLLHDDAAVRQDEDVTGAGC